MKKVDTSQIVAGLRRLGATKATFDHMQEAYTEALASVITGLAGSAGVTALFGCINSGSGSNYNISAGSVYYGGEVYDVPLFAGSAGGGQVPVLILQTTYRAGDPVRYSDGSDQNTHSIRKLTWSFGAPGSGLADFSALVTLKLRINTTLLDVPGQISAAIAALVASSPAALDTLNELAASLGNDANFATTVTTALSLKANKAQTAWQTIALNVANGYSAGSRTPQYRIDQFGQIHLRGVINIGGSPPAGDHIVSDAAALPVPAQRADFIQWNSNFTNVRTCYVSTAGTLRADTATGWGGTFILDGLRYWTD